MVLGELFYTIAPVYIDDIIVHSRTFEEHLEDVGQVFERIQGANGVSARKKDQIEIFSKKSF